MAVRMLKEPCADRSSNAAIHVEYSNRFCILFRETMISDNSAAFGADPLLGGAVFYERRPRALWAILDRSLRRSRLRSLD